MRVLDASAFIRGHDPEGPLATTPGVRAELDDDASYRFEAMEGAGMSVHVPDEAAVDRARDAATETGDRGTLSETDLRLLAAALDLDGTVVTDDYAVQNVADHLGVTVEPIAREGITEKREWIYQCQGCGREFDDDRERCPVCGADLERKNPG